MRSPILAILNKATFFPTIPTKRLTCPNLGPLLREPKIGQERTRRGPIRTESLISVEIKITLNETIPVYQKLAGKIKELKVLGMSNEEIALRLKINRKTVGKALRGF
jgi:hypothetical protein